MSDLLIDSTGDYAFVDNDFVLLEEGPDAVEQRLSINLKLFLGEWFIDTSKGVPYYQDVLKKNPKAQVLEAVFTDAILATDGMDRLDKLDLTLVDNERKLQVDFAGVDEDGNTITQSQVVP